MSPTNAGNGVRSTDADELIRMIGSPFDHSPVPSVSDDDLLRVFESAFENRVALLYLSIHRRDEWEPRLEERFSQLNRRENMTRSVLAEVARVLNEFDPDAYAIFKSLKPYPATPNDTDVIFFGPAKQYELAYDYLIQKGYLFHEWAPHQRTLYDPRGADIVGKGKKGGTYYIDFYSDISTDYYSYSNKHRLRPYVSRQMIEGVSANILQPEPELAIVLFHSLFPERSYQLEHFFLPLYSFADPDFDVECFLRFVRAERYEFAISTSLTLTSHLHQRVFGTEAGPVSDVLRELGNNERELRTFTAGGERLPYLYSHNAFWRAFAQKTRDPYAARSLVVQAWKMLNPVFFLDVIRSLRLRLGSEGAYHLE